MCWEASLPTARAGARIDASEPLAFFWTCRIGLGWATLTLKLIQRINAERCRKRPQTPSRQASIQWALGRIDDAQCDARAPYSVNLAFLGIGLEERRPEIQTMLEGLERKLCMCPASISREFAGAPSRKGEP